jgi:hypothetical protein
VDQDPKSPDWAAAFQFLCPTSKVFFWQILTSNHVLGLVDKMVNSKQFLTQKVIYLPSVVRKEQAMVPQGPQSMKRISIRAPRVPRRVSSHTILNEHNVYLKMRVRSPSKSSFFSGHFSPSFFC